MNQVLILVKVLIGVLDRYLLALSLKRLHLKQLNDRFLDIEDLQSLLKVARLNLCKIKKIIHKEVKNVGTRIENL